MGFVAAMELRWAMRRSKSPNQSGLKSTRIPIFISTKPSHVNPQELRNLYTCCNHSCQPHHHPSGNVEAVNLDKLRIALSHSSVLVSVFCNSQDLFVANDNGTQVVNSGGGTGGGGGGGGGGVEEKEKQVMGAGAFLMLGDLFQSLFTPSSRQLQLVGFGRAVSDLGLTASIYDVMVIPSLQGMGIGRMIVKKIVRMLTSRDIYDISALCSEKERLFFKACGFGDDILGSTTMMYTRAVSSTSCEGDQVVKQEKMIHQKRSLLTGPTAILGGMVTTVVVANYLFVENDPFLKPDQRKPNTPPSTK